MLKHIQAKNVNTKLIPAPAKVCLRCTGGVGDAMVIIGGAARKLSKLGYTVTASVREHQKDLILHMEGVSGWVKPQTMHQIDVRQQFDCIIDFSAVFNTSHELRRGGYYELASRRLGMEFGPGRFKRDAKVFAELQGVQTIALHPGASHPNRRWANGKWEELAYKLSANGNYILWLGTKDEFGFNDPKNKIIKLSDDSEDLVYHVDHLSQCNYFVGNDSGFAHAAGILGVTGLVLFMSTHPADVINQYHSLRGVHHFQNYDDPSRSLRVANDKDSLYNELLTVGRVMAASPYKDIGVESKDTKQICDRLKINLQFTGQKHEDIFRFISDNYSLDQKDFDLSIMVDSERNCQLKTDDSKAGLIIRHVETLRRAIREFLNRKS